MDTASNDDAAEPASRQMEALLHTLKVSRQPLVSDAFVEHFYGQEMVPKQNQKSAKSGTRERSVLGDQYNEHSASLEEQKPNPAESGSTEKVHAAMSRSRKTSVPVAQHNEHSTSFEEQKPESGSTEKVHSAMSISRETSVPVAQHNEHGTSFEEQKPNPAESGSTEKSVPGAYNNDTQSKMSSPLIEFSTPTKTAVGEDDLIAQQETTPRQSIRNAAPSTELHEDFYRRQPAAAATLPFVPSKSLQILYPDLSATVLSPSVPSELRKYLHQHRPAAAALSPSVPSERLENLNQHPPFSVPSPLPKKTPEMSEGGGDISHPPFQYKIPPSLTIRRNDPPHTQTTPRVEESGGTSSSTREDNNDNSSSSTHRSPRMHEGGKEEGLEEHESILEEKEEAQGLGQEKKMTEDKEEHESILEEKEEAQGLGQEKKMTEDKEEHESILEEKEEAQGLGQEKKMMEDEEEIFSKTAPTSEGKGLLSKGWETGWNILQESGRRTYESSPPKIDPDHGIDAGKGS
ncbi:uncharacterized protein MYCGRDRAFT_97946 [Zymoseptoria tritici IPO323]|uniref:Uncharacterized protein n=1 Tax=Zymoseptoria tritici (strain CBS 115943 / IPO323) TaxID=336722 RepID=F9XRV4_ZYMTI|nr:uncharacterized protein MYCGRDRAFT_97946 [Zymoseptoria tritici IPO323]EGP81980.1 hypothetical protein MYCGRDRAFT_97946 [Zymoseptoria tritici IPO323]